MNRSRRVLALTVALTASATFGVACSSDGDEPAPTTVGGLQSIDGPASVDSGVVVGQP